jgi:hypothetical protein
VNTNRRSILVVTGVAVFAAFLGFAVLALVGSFIRPHSLGLTETICKLPSGDTVVATGKVCRKLSGSTVANDGVDAETLYAAWRSDNRTHHNRAYWAAQVYLNKFPQGSHASELRNWTIAYDRAMKSLALLGQTAAAAK